MRKVIFSILTLLVLLGLIGALLKHKDEPSHPANISNGVEYHVPYHKVKDWYIKGLNKEYTFDHILQNQVTDSSVDSTQVLFDGDLQADSGIKYQSSYVGTPDVVKIHIYGDIDPRKIRAYFRKSK